MADLKYIMDVADDEDLGNDKYSRQPSVSGSARSPNPSSTTKQSDDSLPPSNPDPSKSQQRRRVPLSRSSRPTTTISPTTATASVDKASSSRHPFLERRSVDSTESMDPAGYGSYTQSASSSTMPPSSRSNVSSRPMSSTPGESNLPVKLTPITGRVSRAKKGVPVHTYKIYSRAILKDSEFSVYGPRMNRKLTMDDGSEQDDRSGTDVTGTTSRQTSHTPIERNQPMSGFLQPPMLPGNNLSIADDMSANTSYPGSASPYSASHRGSISGQGPMSPSAHSTRSSHSAGPSQDGDYILSSTTNHHVPPFGMHASSHLPQESNWPSSASGSPYSTPDRAMIRGYESPNTDIANHDMYYVPHQFHSPQQPVYHPVSDYTYPDDTGYYDFQSPPFPVRNPILPTVTLSAQPTENLVTLGHAVSDASAILGREKVLAGSTFLTAFTPLPAALNAVPRYLDVYWKRFDTLFPLVHRRSLGNSDDPVLRYAMAALGSQFLQNKEDRINGQHLHGFASQEARRRPHWSVQVMQTILLCEFYSRFRGSRAVARSSEPFQSLYSRVAAPQTSVDQDTSISTSHRHWDEWIRTESRRRLHAACFVLDIHTSIYHEHSPLYPSIYPEHSSLHNSLAPPPPIPLIRSTKDLWAAPNPEAWQGLLSSDPDQLNFASLSDEEITSDHVAKALPLDFAVYLASETLRLRRRSSASSLDITADLDLDSTKRLCILFPKSPVANTYLALHYTPLRDLLAVSGDSWLFSRKILDQEDFQRRKVIVRSWSSSFHAGAASIFAAKALLAFFDTNDTGNTPNDHDSTGGNRQGGGWNMSEISDYWALYVCALICWSLGHSLGHRTTRGTVGRGGADDNPSASGKGESEAKGWLKILANLSPEAAIENVRARREALGVIAMVRRRLEGETIGGKSKLLVDAVRVLKSLEEDPNRGRF
ncbi:hypothetical protein GQX73_g5949 [Xylaria multiplex]|uniref:Xylanolytic transcriptional activator regulatory domain-containing protein n=1 Tax=Xylaria multiplex TaxID=323545 RepID=A0A7C8IQF6_9PEZI|nr:hypothetical protein GQX73_g5949 [Xylaria multiplex]